jgi:hypothetical protein
MFAMPFTPLTAVSSSEGAIAGSGLAGALEELAGVSVEVTVGVLVCFSRFSFFSPLTRGGVSRMKVDSLLSMAKSSDAAYKTINRLKLSDHQHMTTRLPSGTFNRSRGWAAALERLLVCKAIGTLLNVTRMSLLAPSSQAVPYSSVGNAWHSALLVD